MSGTVAASKRVYPSASGGGAKAPLSDGAELAERPCELVVGLVDPPVVSPELHATRDRANSPMAGNAFRMVRSLLRRGYFAPSGYAPRQCPPIAGYGQSLTINGGP